VSACERGRENGHYVRLYETIKVHDDDDYRAAPVTCILYTYVGNVPKKKKKRIKKRASPSLPQPPPVCGWNSGSSRNDSKNNDPFTFAAE